MNIQDSLQYANQILKNYSDSPRIDGEYLLLHVLKKTKAFLYTYPTYTLTQQEQDQFQSLIEKRLQGKPVAYLLGEAGFTWLTLKVNEDVLVPRPETELLVETILQKFTADTSLTIADLGTGSGAIALSIALKRPHWTIYATDISPAALTVAHANKTAYSLHNVILLNGDWCQSLPQRNFLDIIVSNPPYIGRHEIIDNAVRLYEPATALFAEQDGYADLFKIIIESKNYLKQGGLLILEHGYRQAERVRNFLLANDYCDIETQVDLNNLPRMTLASKNF